MPRAFAIASIVAGALGCGSPHVAPLSAYGTANVAIAYYPVTGSGPFLDVRIYGPDCVLLPPSVQANVDGVPLTVDPGAPATGPTYWGCGGKYLSDASCVCRSASFRGPLPPASAQGPGRLVIDDGSAAILVDAPWLLQPRGLTLRAPASGLLHPGDRVQLGSTVPTDRFEPSGLHMTVSTRSPPYLGWSGTSWSYPFDANPDGTVSFTMPDPCKDHPTTCCWDGQNDNEGQPCVAGEYEIELEFDVTVIPEITSCLGTSACSAQTSLTSTTLGVKMALP